MGHDGCLEYRALFWEKKRMKTVTDTRIKKGKKSLDDEFVFVFFLNYYIIDDTRPLTTHIIYSFFVFFFIKQKYVINRNAKHEV